MKEKRNRKVNLETLLEKGENIYENISPSSMRLKTSGRDITYNRLRFNLN